MFISEQVLGEERKKAMRCEMFCLVILTAKCIAPGGAKGLPLASIVPMILGALGMQALGVLLISNVMKLWLNPTLPAVEEEKSHLYISWTHVSLLAICVQSSTLKQSHAKPSHGLQSSSS